MKTLKVKKYAPFYKYARYGKKFSPLRNVQTVSNVSAAEIF